MTYAIKFLAAGARGYYSGFEWPTPQSGRPGRWVSVKGELVPCENGIHAATLEQAPPWIDTEAYLIELGGQIIDDRGKLCARKGRLIRRLPWDERTARLCAADFAEHVLPIWDAERPDDDRPRKAIEAARAYACGEVGDAELAAAGAAAATAARYAAGDAAGAARYAAWAARYAVWDAAGAASWDAERKWQAQRLAHYLDCPEVAVHA